MNREHNRLLTEVEGEAPMGAIMRQHWIPCALSATLVADGAPKRVRLLGKNYVAFRASDGRIGFFDEACPHRGVSLVLARNEDCALRCIFHGWKFDVSGAIVDIPSEGARTPEYAARIKLNHYPSFEGGGLLWVFLGEGTPPPKPPLPFLDLPPENIWISRSIAPSNWLQGVEGTIDSVHVGTLHQSWIAKQFKGQPTAPSIGLTIANHPRYEVEHTDYGLRAAALRTLADGKQYVRVTEYVMPFVSLVPGGLSQRTGTMFIAVPMDNVSHMLFWGLWDETGPTSYLDSEQVLRVGERDIDNYARAIPDAEGTWGQNRAAMAEGHFSGFDSCLLDEDMVVQASMGPIADRTREQLVPSDVGIMQTRRRLLEELGVMMPIKPRSVSVGVVRPLDTIADASYMWQATRPDAQPLTEG